jgi:hypothetical protein
MTASVVVFIFAAAAGLVEREGAGLLAVAGAVEMSPRDYFGNLGHSCYT